jgi:hypothetical protein
LGLALLACLCLVEELSHFFVLFIHVNDLNICFFLCFSG